MYVQNVGVGPAGVFAVGFYGYCEGYTFTDAPKRISGLAPGEEKFIRVTFSLPLGDCHVGAEIDHDNVVQESNETNNEFEVAVTSE